MKNLEVFPALLQMPKPCPRRCRTHPDEASLGRNHMAGEIRMVIKPPWGLWLATPDSDQRHHLGR